MPAEVPRRALPVPADDFLSSTQSRLPRGRHLAPPWMPLVPSPGVGKSSLITPSQVRSSLLLDVYIVSLTHTTLTSTSSRTGTSSSCLWRIRVLQGTHSVRSPAAQI
ncbi:hypothetical protein OH76DRAFT_1490438 [Lentinus brumalis]|uniref:Uncharacterized protein n=1 Tax=Lentinus brumalis TaxID=2498619 RepID=A0A371CIZ6_9APHY|nr:hypothetical protein OH76DRAFT_1490438 [Polyporus brumalis]